MKLTLNAHDKGKTAYNKGMSRKPTNDGAFMQELENVKEGNKSRRIKSVLIEEWKNGWDTAKKDNK